SAAPSGANQWSSSATSGWPCSTGGSASPSAPATPAAWSWACAASAPTGASWRSTTTGSRWWRRSPSSRAGRPSRSRPPPSSWRRARPSSSSAGSSCPGWDELVDPAVDGDGVLVPQLGRDGPVVRALYQHQLLGVLGALVEALGELGADVVVGQPVEEEHPAHGLDPGGAGPAVPRDVVVREVHQRGVALELLDGRESRLHHQ